VIPIGDLWEPLNGVNQLDWGDFFLFKQYPKDWDNPEVRPYPFVITQAEVTVRVVDNQYFYIYTTLQTLVDMIKSEYTIESVKTAPLEKLDFPV